MLQSLLIVVTNPLFGPPYGTLPEVFILFLWWLHNSALGESCPKTGNFFSMTKSV